MKRRRYHLGLETFSQIDIDRGADAVRCVRVRMRVRARMCAWSSTCAWSCDCGGLCRAPIVDHARSMRSHAESCVFILCFLGNMRVDGCARALGCCCSHVRVRVRGRALAWPCLQPETATKVSSTLSPRPSTSTSTKYSGEKRRRFLSKR